MAVHGRNIRVLYSFPHKIGASRICTTAWHQVDGVSRADTDVILYTGSITRSFSDNVEVRTTLSLNYFKKFRIPYRMIGILNACKLHDLLVARAIKGEEGKRVDVVHVWPLGALNTLRAARKAGIPTFLERPNAHTRFAYAAVEDECRKLGITMPVGHEHSFKKEWLEREEEEYSLADHILCPSDFVANTFTDYGYSPKVISRHQYGFDQKTYFPGTRHGQRNRGLRMLFVGGAAPRKGLHYALDAWLKSSACKDGVFRIAGEFIPGYAEVLEKQLAHSSVEVLGHRKDVADLMRDSDVLVLPSIEEGSALVTSEARGSGCVLLVSEAAGAICKHEDNALIHKVGDVDELAKHMSILNNDRSLLDKLRDSSLSTINQLTWDYAGTVLSRLYNSQINES